MTQTTPALFLSTDRKVTTLATASANAVIANAFGLVSGLSGSCPGATSVCESVCYAGKIERQYKAVLSRMTTNLDILRAMDEDAMVEALSVVVQSFVDASNKRGSALRFRIHHDGDFFSTEYANAWARVCNAFPTVAFWVYTRSFVAPVNVIPFIVDIPNLAVYLSVDEDNKDEAAIVLAAFPGVKVAALGKTWADAQAIVEYVRGNAKPVAKCPELTKALPLISAEKGGACNACGLCTFARADIRFASSRK